MGLRVFVVAGEPSGDRLGGALMSGLKHEAPEVAFDGIGGPLMQSQGLASLFPMEELSLMGIAEILPKYRHLKRRIRETAEAVIAAKPDVLITIDSPDFSLRVARLVKAASDIRTVHYVAPTVWAWRPGRAAKMAQIIDHVLALFPFEPPYMEAEGMLCDFVGHPVATTQPATPDEMAALGLDGPVMAVLPGSRRSEIERLSHSFVAAMNEANLPHRVVIPTLPHLADRVGALFEDVDPILVGHDIDDPDAAARQRFVAMSQADVALAASGTVSLELAAARTPMVIAYDMSWLSRQIIGRMLRTDTVTLVNLVSETRVVPEFIGAACLPDAIATGLVDVTAHPQAQMHALETTMQRLGQGGEDPGLRAACAVLRAL